MRSALLRGCDHTTFGTVATIAEGTAAVALSRGGAAKTYPYVHPNEDAALFAEGVWGTLVAVADGHWGSEASAAALERLLETVAEAWTDSPEEPAEGWEHTAEAAVALAAEAVLALRHIEEGRSPRTTLAFALVHPREDQLVVACAGDSHLFRVGQNGGVDDLASEAPRARYLGARARDGTPLAPEPRISVLPLAGTRALVAATDGLSELGIGVANPSAVVAEAVEHAAKVAPALRARDAARGVVEAALGAQRENSAGDNVAAAVAWVAPE